MKLSIWADSSDSSLCVGPVSPLDQPTGFTGVGTNKLVINVSMAMSKHYQGSHPCLVLNSYRVADLSLGNIFLSFASSPVTVSHKPHGQPGPAPAASGLSSSTPKDRSLQKETEANAPLAPLAPPGGPRLSFPQAWPLARRSPGADRLSLPQALLGSPVASRSFKPSLSSLTSSSFTHSFICSFSHKCLLKI